MALTFTDLQTEFFSRGFDYLNDGGPDLARAKRWLNRAKHKVDSLEDWPYMNVTASGTSPLVIADLRTVETVYDSTNRQTLGFADRRDLRRDWGDMTVTGAPSWYFITQGTTINMFPVQAVSLSVDYWKYSADMVNPTDQPDMPDRFRLVIVEYAVADALRDDESVDADRATAAADQIVAEMRSVLLDQQHGDPQWIVPAIGDDC